MNFDEFEKKIMNYPSRQEMISYLDELRETYAKPVEMTITQRDVLIENKEQDTFWVFANLVDDPETFEYHVFRNGLSMSFDDLMRAWLHPELIVVKENE